MLFRQKRCLQSSYNLKLNFIIDLLKLILDWWTCLIFVIFIFIKYNDIRYVMSQEDKKYDCQCGASFDTVEELDKHNHEAH